MSVLARALARCGIIDQKEAAAPPDTLSFSNAITRACTPNQLMGQTLDSIEPPAAVSRHPLHAALGRASCMDRVCQSGQQSGVAVHLNTHQITINLASIL